MSRTSFLNMVTPLYLVVTVILYKAYNLVKNVQAASEDKRVLFSPGKNSGREKKEEDGRVHLSAAELVLGCVKS